MENNEIERYGTKKAWALSLGVPPSTVNARLENAEGIEGRGSEGKVRIFYRESLVRELLADVLTGQELDDIGEVSVDGIRCIAPNKFAKARGMFLQPLQQAIEAAGLSPVGKLRSHRHLIELYEKDRIEELPYVKNFGKQLNDQGEVVINDIACVGINKYAEINGMHSQRIEEEIERTGLEALGEARAGTRTVKVYEKERIEHLPYVVGFRKRAVQPIQDFNEQGEITVNDMTCIAITRYAKAQGLVPVSLQHAIEQAKLPVIAQVRSKTHVLDVYEKEQVDALPYVIASKRIVDEKGEIVIDGVLCVSAGGYAKTHGLSLNLLQPAIKEAGLQAVGKARNYNSITAVYDKSQIESLPYVVRATRKLDENGRVIIDGVPCVGASKYADAHGIHYGMLQRAIEEAGLQVVGQARSGTKPVDVYAEVEVESLPYLQERLRVRTQCSSVFHSESNDAR